MNAHTVSLLVLLLFIVHALTRMNWKWTWYTHLPGTELSDNACGTTCWNIMINLKYSTATYEPSWGFSTSILSAVSVK